MKLRIAIAVMISALVGVAGHDVPATVQLSLFDLLITTAGIVFGVSGAWIALVHASELRADEPQTGRFLNLTRSMVASGITIAAALIAHASHALLSAWGLLGLGLAPCLRGASFGAWTFLALVQLWSIFSMLPSAVYALGEITNRREHRKVIGTLPPPRRNVGH